MPSKGSKFAIAFYWLVIDLLCYVFSKNANSWKTHCVKVTASLNVCHNFLVLMWVRGVCIFIYKWGCKQVNGNTISFFPASFEPYEKKKNFLYHLAHVRESIIIHQVFYSISVWLHSSFQLSNSSIQTISVFIGVIPSRHRTYIECI